MVQWFAIVENSVWLAVFADFNVLSWALKRHHSLMYILLLETNALCNDFV